MHGQPIGAGQLFQSDVVGDMPDVVVATDVDQVEALRDAWQSAGVENIDSDIDHFLAVVRNSPSVIRPHVVWIRRPAKPDLFGIARLEQFSLRVAIGYRTLARPQLRGIVVTSGGIVGAAGAEDEQLILGELGRPLRTGEADALVLSHLDRAGTLHQVARDRGGLLLRVHGQLVSHRWIAKKPETLEAFLSNRSAKTRQTVQRQNRKLERAYGDGLRLVRFDRADQAGDLARDLETVAARSWQRGVGRGYHSDAAGRALSELALSRGWLRAWLLYLNGRPVAFWSGTTYAGTFATGTPGFDPDYTKDSVGRYTMFRMLEDVFSDERVSRLDLGQGDAEYKQAFGPERIDETDVIVLAKRPRAVALGLLSSGVSIVNRWGRRLVRDSAWGRRLEQAWRRRLGAS
jgi:hypothetical protein